MSVPTLEKTWQVSTYSNTPSGSLEQDTDNLFIGIKAALKALSSSAWTVVSSCNGTTVSASDLISAHTDINHNSAGNAHSWIVFLTSSGAHALFDFNSGTVQKVTISWSPGALFTGGSTTAAPTATDSQVLFNDGYWAGSLSATGGQYRGHVLSTTDGACTRVFVCAGGVCAGYWCFETAANPISGWTNYRIASASGIGNTSTDTTLLNVANWLGAAKYSAKGLAAATMPLILTAESTLGSNATVLSALDEANQISVNYGSTAKYQVIQPGLFHTATTGQRGRHGYVFDLFFTNATLATSDAAPAGGGHTFQVIGDMLIQTGGATLAVT